MRNLALAVSVLVVAICLWQTPAGVRPEVDAARKISGDAVAMLPSGIAIKLPDWPDPGITGDAVVVVNGTPVPLTDPDVPPPTPPPTPPPAAQPPPPDVGCDTYLPPEQRIGRFITPTKHEVVRCMHLNAEYFTTDCRFWSFQANCQHFGTDIAGDGDWSTDDENTPVYAPFAGKFLTCIDQGPGGSFIGMAFMYELLDGTEIYIGHMRWARCDRPKGDPVAAGEQIGGMWGYATPGNPDSGCVCHVHVQLRHQVGVLSSIDDFMAYYNSH